MGTFREIPGPFTIDELLNRQLACELAMKTGYRRYEHLDTGWTIDELLEMKASLDQLEDD